MPGKKVIAIAIVAVIVVSSIGAAAILFGGHNGSSSNNNNNNNNKGYESDISKLYFDLSDASSLGICTVKADSDQVSSSVAATKTVALAGKAAVRAAGDEVNHNRPMSHDQYLVPPSKAAIDLTNLQNKLFMDDSEGNRSIVKTFSSSSDMDSQTNEIGYDVNIVYVADAGSFVLIAYYNHPNLGEVYDHLNYHGDFWSADRDYAEVLIYKETGKVYPLTGLWCGCTYAKYEGTNDITPSIQYFGKIKGEDAFLLNINRQMEINNDNTGEFHDKRGLITMYVEDGELKYRELVTERNAGKGVEYDDDGNRITVWDLDAPYLGFVYDLYKNSVVHYYTVTNFYDTEWYHECVVTHYLWFPDGDAITVNKSDIMECDGYACSSVTYSNTYFPTQCTRYKSDGTTETVDIDAADSYRMASEKVYSNMVAKVVQENQTVLYLADVDWTIDRVTLKNDCTFTVDSDIFGKVMFANVPMYQDGLSRYDGRLYYTFDTDHYERKGNCYFRDNMTYAGYIQVKDCLFKMNEGSLVRYNLTDATETVVPLTGMIQLLYIYLDGDGNFIAEGSTSDGYCKAILQEDGSFEYQVSDIALSIVSKVNCGNNNNN